MTTKRGALGKLFLVVILAMLSLGASPPPSVQHIKTEYDDVTAELKLHTVNDWWIDNDLNSPGLLSRQWSLAAEWVAAWLNAHPHHGASGIKAALTALDPSSDSGFLVIAPETFLVASPTGIGNVFIVSKGNDGEYHVAWNIASLQDANQKSWKEIAAWQADKARDGDHSSGLIGSMTPIAFGSLSKDAQGHPRFFIVAYYAQGAGGTVAEQVSLWVWDGGDAIPLLAQSYAVGIEQRVGVRVVGDLLKMQKREDFHTFYSGSSCEQRQVDWIVRLMPNGVKDLGQQVVVPELDTVDELFYRLINNKPARDIADPEAIRAAGAIVEAAGASPPSEKWGDPPLLGMMMSWSITGLRHDEVVCLSIGGVDTDLSLTFKLEQKSGRFYITSLKNTGTASPCPKSKRSGPAC